MSHPTHDGAPVDTVPSRIVERQQNMVWLMVGFFVMVAAAVATIAVLIDMGDAGGSSFDASYSTVDKWQVFLSGLIAFGVGAATSAIGALRS